MPFEIDIGCGSVPLAMNTVSGVTKRCGGTPFLRYDI